MNTKNYYSTKVLDRVIKALESGSRSRTNESEAAKRMYNDVLFTCDCMFNNLTLKPTEEPNCIVFGETSTGDIYRYNITSDGGYEEIYTFKTGGYVHMCADANGDEHIMFTNPDGSYIGFDRVLFRGVRERIFVSVHDGKTDDVVSMTTFLL